jgi:type IV secretion system protein VirB11
MFLFQQETEKDLSFAEVLALGRGLLVSSLNKGAVPSWDLFFQELPVLKTADDLDAMKNYFERLTTFSFMEELLTLKATEYFFHSMTRSLALAYNGEKTPLSIALEAEDWQLWLEIIAVHFKQNWNVQNPFVSFYGELFGQKFRFSLIHFSTSPEGQSKLFLRSLASHPHALDSFGETQTLVDLVKQKKNILIAGSTGSGKTSLLTALLTQVEREEHVVILEDTYEIFTDHPFETRLLAGDTPQKSLKSYLSYAMRLSPDRIILGEMRSHEVVPYLMAMNTGHRGLMGTIHASSASEALSRVALLFSIYGGDLRLDFDKVMELICRNLEYVVFMENKKVKEVIKILGCERGIPFYENLNQTLEEPWHFMKPV